MERFGEHGDAAGACPAAALDAEACRQLFGSLHRNGQRLKAEQYVRGLLSVPGRKTLRNLAARFDGAAAQQSVHHFITTSPWDWLPIRHALARQTQRTLAPQAWVIDTTLIPKAGPYSVGTDPQSTALGTVNGQQAVGTWLASERTAVPVDWQLRLSDRWLADPLRRRAGVPEDAALGTVEECVRRAVTGLLDIAGMTRLPVVVDVAELDGVSVARFLLSTGLPFVVRTSATAPARIDRSELPSYGNLLRSAGELAESLPQLRQRANPGDGCTTAMAVPVLMSRCPRDAMTLLVEWRPGRRVDRRLWLTNLDASRLVPALRLTRLPGVVARVFSEVSDDVGLRDFAGRSFPGWHRHITLASVAHLVAAWAREDAERPAARQGGGTAVPDSGRMSPGQRDYHPVT
ncbi:transposase [Streptomyces sp. JB150]|uniref:IS701 family transposase n=1 Tax=Streptomyces sp. JB150 TaxID=2714844 RepID=UPI0014098478|nr:transposase [Streptomyces sp. JB150]QIJ65857.1 transposase [Streptomyces sp. JB150]